MCKMKALSAEPHRVLPPWFRMSAFEKMRSPLGREVRTSREEPRPSNSSYVDPRSSRQVPASIDSTSRSGPEDSSFSAPPNHSKGVAIWAGEEVGS